MKTIYPKMSIKALAKRGFQYTGEYRRIKHGDQYLSCYGNSVFRAAPCNDNISDVNRWIVVPLSAPTKSKEYIKLPDLTRHETHSDFANLGETRDSGTLKNKGLFLYNNRNIIFSVEIDNQGCQVLVAKRAKT